ncbi:hypothetical protein C6P41_004302 [Kluyveromyces marxianus]|nr:hypothetical protein C6P43_003841 [Kluyveromyces marxianus]KAG0681634.1 hypothetical protein C6P41_004302 [Kluyveromyces marxianus]
MALLSYASDLFMPLFCSSRAYVVVFNLINLIAIYAAVYWSSSFLQSTYNVPGIFAPNSQDYFRTSLLGFLSPFLLYFIKTFLFSVNSSYLALNIVVEHCINDWFMLLIIFSLAYPQLQDSTSPIGGFSFHFGKTDSSTVWHIIPKQCYIFGISWSFSEVVISVMETLYNYEEVSSFTESDLKASMMSNTSDGYEDIRKEIELGKCVSIRRNRSKISSNVYSPGYGSTNFPSVASTPESATNQDINSDESTMVINFNTDTMKFLNDIESHGNDMGNYQWIPIRTGSFSYQQSSPLIQHKVFPRIQNWKELMSKIAVSNLIHIDYILNNVGQALILSIYFIYVPSHPSLFTKIVVYFGSKSFANFLLSVVIPFFVIRALFFVFLYTWKDMSVSVYNAGSSSQEQQHPSRSLNTEFAYDTINTPLMMQTSAPQNLTSIRSVSPENVLLYHSIHPPVDVNLQTDDSKLLRLSRRIVNFWQKSSTNPWFVPIGLTCWSITVFVISMLATVKFDSCHN